MNLTGIFTDLTDFCHSHRDELCAPAVNAPVSIALNFGYATGFVRASVTEDNGIRLGVVLATPLGASESSIVIPSKRAFGVAVTYLAGLTAADMAADVIVHGLDAAP